MSARRTRAAAALAIVASLAAGAANAQTPARPPTAYPGGTWEPGPPTHGAPSTQDTTVTMPDGVRLRATISYPTERGSATRAPGRFPVLIEFTPYVRLGTTVGPMSYFSEHGYIVVVVRPRGTGGSEGEVQQFSSQDGRDGKAIVDWAATSLDGSDGRIGMVGCSYPGALGLITAAHVGPKSPVKAVVASCIGLDMQHRQTWTTNGMPNATLYSYAPVAKFLMGDSPSVTNYFEGFLKGVLAGGPEAYDGPYWQDRGSLKLAADIARNDIPVLLWSGWSDINDTGAVHAYTALQNAWHGRPYAAPMARNTPVTPRVQIIMGNWGHGEGLDIGVYLQWFETWIKGRDTGLQQTQRPMHLFEMGTQRWTNLARYPVVDRYTRWYLRSGGALAAAAGKAPGDDALAWALPDEANARLSFETPAYAKGATLAGPISATLYASSSNTNLAVLARLLDVAPDGTSTVVTKGGLLGSQSALDADKTWTDANGTRTWPWPKLERDTELVPEQVARLDIPMAPRQWGVRPGHKLRLELTTRSPASLCPEDKPAPMLPEPCGLTAPQQKTLPGGRYKIMRGGAWPSALNLPQMPFRALTAVPAGPMPTAWTENKRVLEANKLTLPMDWRTGRP